MRTPIVRAILFFVLMVCLLVPLGFLALWGAKYARPNFVSSWLTKVGDRRLVIGYNNTSLRSNQFYCTDLETGFTSTRVFALMRRTLRAGNNVGTKAWVFGELNKNQFAWQMGDLESDQATTVQLIDTANGSKYGESMIVFENRLIRMGSNTLELVNPLTGSIEDEYSLPIKDFSYLHFVFDRNTFLLVGAKDPTSNLRNVFLFDISEGKLRKIAQWSDLHHLVQMIGDNCYLVSLLEDGATIEVRNTVDGEVVSQYSVPQNPLLPTPLAFLGVLRFGESWLQWQNVPTLHTDILTGQTLPIPLDSVLIEQDFAGHRLITLRRKAQGALGWDCILLDKSSGNELSRFDVAREHYTPGSALGGRFLDGVNRLVLTTRDHQVFVYDLTSGKLVRSIDPFFWSEWCSRFVIVVYSLWCLVWLFVSAKLHPHGWLDLAVCSGLVVALYANHYPADLLVCLCIFAAWILVSVSWLIFGKMRWSLRFQPLLLLVGITLGLINILPADVEERVLTWVASGQFFVMLLYLIGLLSLRWFRYRIEPDVVAPERLLPDCPKNQTQSIALRDLFLLTIVFAILFSIFRLLPSFNWNYIKMREGILICILAVWASGAGLFAMWVALSRSSWKLRWGIVLAFWIVIDLLVPLVLGRAIPTEILHPTFITTLFGFSAYRLRGWRLSAVCPTGCKGVFVLRFILHRAIGFKNYLRRLGWEMVEWTCD